MPQRFGFEICVYIAVFVDFLQDFLCCYIFLIGFFLGIEFCFFGFEGDLKVVIWGDSYLCVFKEGFE